jgi:hypothetical protein
MASRSLKGRCHTDLRGVQADPIPGMLCDVPGDMSDHLLLQELTSEGVVGRINVQLGILWDEEKRCFLPL